MRSIGAIVIFGSILFVLASIGLTAKAIADLINPISTLGSSSSINPNSINDSTSISSSFTISSPTPISSSALTTSSTNDDSLTYFSTTFSPSITNSISTSAGASVWPSYTPSSSYNSNISNNQNDDDGGSSGEEENSSEDYRNKGVEGESYENENNDSTSSINQNGESIQENGSKEQETGANDGVVYQNALLRPTYLSNTVQDTNDQNYGQNPIFSDFNQETPSQYSSETYPYLQIMPSRSTRKQIEDLVVLSKRLLLQEGSNSSSNDGSYKQNLIVLLVLFIFQEILLILFLILSFTFLWRFNTVDFNAEYQIILSRQSIQQWTQKAEEALLAAKKRTLHIRTFLITFTIIGILLIAIFIASFALLSIWFTVNDDLTIITIACDALSIFILVLICISLLFDHRKSKKEEEYATIFEENQHSNLPIPKQNEKAASIISSIGSFSSFKTPPGWRHIRSSITRRGKERNSNGYVDQQQQQQHSDAIIVQEEERRQQYSNMHSLEPRPNMERFPTASIPSIQPSNIERSIIPVPSINDESGLSQGTEQEVRYVGRPLRRITPLENLGSYRQEIHQNPLSSPIGTPPPIPGMEVDTRYPSHMIQSLPSSSSSQKERFAFSLHNKQQHSFEEEREEYVRSLSDHSRSHSDKKRNKNLPSTMTTNVKELPDFPQSPIPESPSSIYSDVLLSPGTLCVAVPNSKGGTTMMPVAVGQSYQHVL